jgi:hypothetical protein
MVLLGRWQPVRRLRTTVGGTDVVGLGGAAGAAGGPGSPRGGARPLIQDRQRPGSYGGGHGAAACLRRRFLADRYDTVYRGVAALRSPALVILRSCRRKRRPDQSTPAGSVDAHAAASTPRCRRARCGRRSFRRGWAAVMNVLAEDYGAGRVLLTGSGTQALQLAIKAAPGRPAGRLSRSRIQPLRRRHRSHRRGRRISFDLIRPRWLPARRPRPPDGVAAAVVAHRTAFRRRGRSWRRWPRALGAADRGRGAGARRSLMVNRWARSVCSVLSLGEQGWTAGAAAHCWGGGRRRAGPVQHWRELG